MRYISKTLAILTSTFFVFALFFSTSTVALAVDACTSHFDNFNIISGPSIGGNFRILSGSDELISEVFVGDELDPAGTYNLLVCALVVANPINTNQCINYEGESNSATINNGTLTFSITDPDLLKSNGLTRNDTHNVFLQRTDTNENICFVGNYTTDGSIGSCEGISFSQERAVNGVNTTCEGGCFVKDKPVTVTAHGLKDAHGNPFSGPVTFVIGESGLLAVEGEKSDDAVNGTASITFTPDGVNEFSVGVKDKWSFNNYFVGCRSTLINTKEFCPANFCADDSTILPDIENGSNLGNRHEYKLCEQIGNDDLKLKCQQCAGGENDTEGVWTAVGCIKNDPKDIVARFIEIGLGLGGGVCLLTCLAGGFMITTSQGEPKKVNDAKEMITNALIGLLFIIFSVTILQFIGVTIFNIPGFGTTTP